MTLKLGVPSKGRLQAKCFDFFADHGIALSQSGDSREYAGRVGGFEGLDLVLLSAGEIPRELAAGRIHLGVTGRDLVEEALPEQAVLGLKALGFGFADLVVAVPQFWIDTDWMDDLDAVAASFRAAHGHRLRIATKYHNLVRRFFQKHDIADYQIVDSQGATEGTVKNETAEAIADITSTGETLRANHLKVLQDGLILKSEATLYAAPAAPWSSGEQRTFQALADRLGLAAEKHAPWSMPAP